MRRNIVVLSTLAPCAVLCGYLAVAQDVTSPRPRLYPSLEPEPRELSEMAQLIGREKELNGESRKLVRDYSRTEDASERRELEEQLRKTVDDHFSIKQRLRARELRELEAKVKKLRSRHERRNDARARIVQDRVQQLLRAADGLGWGSDIGGPDRWSGNGLGTRPVLPDVVIEEIQEHSAETARRVEEARARAERARVPKPPAKPSDPRR